MMIDPTLFVDVNFSVARMLFNIKIKDIWSKARVAETEDKGEQGPAANFSDGGARSWPTKCYPPHHWHCINNVKLSMMSGRRLVSMGLQAKSKKSHQLSRYANEQLMVFTN